MVRRIKLWLAQRAIQWATKLIIDESIRQEQGRHAEFTQPDPGYWQ